MRHHKHECSVMGKFMSGDSGREVPHVVRAVMQILLMRSKKVISDDEWGQLLALESHFDDFRSAGGRKFEEIKLLANGAWTFSGTQLTVDLEVAETLFTRVSWAFYL